MINSKSEYILYLSEDKKALGIKNKRIFNFLNPYEIDCEIWQFQKALRKCEYLYNVNSSL